MIPSLWTDFLREWEPEDAIRMIGEAGFRCVEFSCIHEQDYLEGREDEGKRLISIKRAADIAGVKIMQMHGRIFNCCDDHSEANVAWMHRSVRRAAAMGAEWVVLHPGSRPNLGADPAEMEFTRRHNVEVFQALLNTAGEVGVGIAIENLYGRKPHFGSYVSDLIWMLEQLNGPVGICWDTGHANVAGLDQAVALRTLGKRVVALHLHDNDGNSDQHLTPLRGQIRWPDIMQALSEIGYVGAFNLEVPGESRVTPVPARSAKIRYLAEICKYLLEPAFVSEKASA